MAGHDVYVGRLPLTAIDDKLSIHSQKSRKFMKEIGVPQLAMAILRDGYKLPMSESPTYFEENNKSAGEYLGGVWAGDASKFQATAYDVNDPK